MADKITLESLYGENFKCHKELNIDFSENKLVVVSGRNGTGKTSILDAIFWCLYDETIKGVKGDKVVTHKVGKDCYVRLIFKINETRYEIHNYRKHTKFKNTKILIRDGVQISTDMDVAETNNIIQNIFMPKDIFTNSLLFSTYVKNSFTEMTHSGQKDILDQLLGFEKYNEMYKKITDAISEENIIFSEKKKEYDKLKFELENLQNKLPNDINLYTEIQNSTKTRGLEYEEKIKQLKIQLDSISYSESDYKFAYESLEKSKEELNKIQNKIDNINTKIEQEQKTIKESQHNLFQTEIQLVKDKTLVEINEIQKKEKEYTTHKNSELITSEKDVVFVQNNIDNFNTNKKAKIDNVEKRLLLELSKVEDPFKENFVKILDSIYELESEEKHLTHTINNDNYYLNLKQTELKNIKDNSDICVLCKQPLSDKTHIEIKRKELTSEIKELEKTISKNNKLLETCRSNLISKNSEKESIEKEIAKKKDNLHQKANAMISKVDLESSDELEKLQSSLNESKKKLNSIKDEIYKFSEQCNNQINDLKNSETNQINKIKEKYKAQYESLINNLNKQSEQSKKELEVLKSICNDDVIKFKNSVEELIQNKQTIDNINSNIKLYMEEVSKLKAIFKKDGENYKTLIDNLKKEIELVENKFKIIDEDFKQIQEKCEILNFWKKAFSDVGIKSVLLDESIPILNKRAKELSELTDNIRVSFSSQTMLKSGKTNNKFSINAINSKHLSEYDEFSAGETRLTNIIILLCLRDLMENMSGKKINLLLLDEILDSLDEQNSELAGRIIQYLSKEFYVMLITHTHKASIMSDEDIRL